MSRETHLTCGATFPCWSLNAQGINLSEKCEANVMPYTQHSEGKAGPQVQASSEQLSKNLSRNLKIIRKWRMNPSIWWNKDRNFVSLQRHLLSIP